MKYKKIFLYLLLACLLYLSLEILFRRFILKQIPTQISTYFVYFILLINFISIFIWVKKSKQDKN